MVTSVTATAGTNLVLFDDHCPLCTFQSRLLTWLDWFNVLTLLPISHPRAAEVAPELTRADLLEAIHCVSARGPIYRGARAIRYVGLRMPLLVPLALFLWFPGVIWVAERVYMSVSRNRHVLSRLFGCNEACALLPARSREREREIESRPLESSGVPAPAADSLGSIP
jgi:predicted DCC family thiol-disulfide oxidoreductase YuxK